MRNAEKLPDDSIIVLNGDIFTDIDLGIMLRLHRRDKAVASLTLTPVEGPTIYGVAETNSEGRIKRFIEKPSRAKVTANMISADIYILEPDILNYMAPNTFAMFERDVFPLVLGKGTGCMWPFRDYWIDIGTPDKYVKSQQDLLRSGVFIAHLARFTGFLPNENEIVEESWKIRRKLLTIPEVTML